VTKEELKKILPSKPNKLAQKAIEVIKSDLPMTMLKQIVDAGSSDRYYYRDPLHPRSKYRVEHVLDACLESSFGIIGQASSAKITGSHPPAMVLGHVSPSRDRSAQFEFLVDRGFQPGTNAYRGNLFTAVLRSCFCRDSVESSISIKLARILVDRAKVDIQAFAECSYEWTGSEEKLNRVLSLGARPSPKMLDCALQYCVCAQNQGDPSSGRADVIRKLLDAGIAPSKPLGRLGTAAAQLSFLEAHGLAERVLPPRPLLPTPRAPSTPSHYNKKTIGRQV